MALIILAGAVFRIALLPVGRFHPDEALFSTLARLVASGQDPLLAHTTLLVDKPPLFYYTLALSVISAGGREAALRLPALIASLISIPLAGRLAWRLWRSWPAACLTMIFAALCPFAIQFSPTVFSDPQVVVWLLASAVAAVERRWGLSAILFGLSLASKQSAAFFLPLVIFLGLSRSASSSVNWPSLARPALRFCTGLLIVLAVIIIWDRLRAPATSFWVAAVDVNNPGRLIRSTEVWPRASAWLAWASAFTGAPLLDLPGAAALLIVVPLEIAAGRKTRAAIGTLILMTVLLAYIAALWFVAFPLLDRYLLPVVYLLALLCARGLDLAYRQVIALLRSTQIHRTLSVAAPAALALILLPSAVQAARGGYPVGGDHGAYSGIDSIASYLNARPMGTVVYSHDMSWELGYYLFDAYVYRAYFETPSALAADLRSFGDSPEERYIALAGHESLTEISQAAAAAGFRLAPVDLHIASGLRLYRLEHAP